jgi:DNA-binding transcriptional MocR family regulator
MSTMWKPTLLESQDHLYLAVVKALADDIESGALAHGSRLPTHRELADSLGVAIGTITRAYGEAERRGLIHSEGRRGTFVGTGSGQSSSLNSLFDVGPQMIDLSKNHPTYTEDPDLRAALREIAHSSDAQTLLHYAPSEGHIRHQRAGAEWMRQMGFEVDPDSVIVTAGAQHGLNMIFAAVAEPGDLIAAESVTYPGVKAIAQLLQLKLMPVAMDDDGPLPDALDTLCQQRRIRALYINPTLHNPTGITYPESRRREIAEVARDYGVLIIEDEILRPLVPDSPPPISAFAPEMSFAVVSASKAIAAGLRSGFLTTPPDHKQKLIETIRTFNLALPALPIEVLARWIEDGTAQSVVERRRQEFGARMDLVSRIMAGHTFNITPYSCYIWLRLPSNWTATQFTVEAHRRGVAVAPAEVFAVERGIAANAVRISLGTVPDRSILENGLQTLAEILSGSPQQDSTAI